MHGFVALERQWQAGDKVELHLPMPLRFSDAIDKVQANRQRLAITRGPLVYCAEQADNGNKQVQRFYIPEPCPPEQAGLDTIRTGPLRGIPRLSLPGHELTASGSRPTKIKMIPYYAWNNRGEESMIIWLPRTEAGTQSQ